MREDEPANSSSREYTHEETGKNKASVKKGQDRKKEKRKKAEKQQLIYNTLKPLLTEVERVEGRITELEVRQKELEKLLADPDIFSDKNRGVLLFSEYKALREEQNALLLKWEQGQDKLEITRKELGAVDGYRCQ
jgi:hypothetical protein